VRSLGNESAAAGTASQCGYRDAAADRWRDPCGIGLDEVRDFTSAGEGVWVGVGKREIGQPHRPVGKLESQAVPALGSPTFCDPVPFEHKVRATAPPEHMAHH